jgi:hypothetical protein
MKYDGTDNYNRFLACLYIFTYDYTDDDVLLQGFFIIFFTGVGIGKYVTLDRRMKVRRVSNQFGPELRLFGSFGLYPAFEFSD